MEINTGQSNEEIQIERKERTNESITFKYLCMEINKGESNTNREEGT